MDEQAVREELGRILADPRFASADRLSRFLQFVVDKKLAGESDEIKEYLIALEVYQRKPDYDPKADSLVRVEASRLRARLEEYYKSRGAGNPIRISLPKGGYVPMFDARQAPHAEADDLAPRANRALLWRGAAVGIVLAAVIAAGSYGLWRSKSSPAEDSKIRSIAILPFVSLSGEPEGERMADGLTEELTTLAVGLDGIKVAARTSAYQFKNKAVSVTDAGRQLGVDGVIEGSLRQQGDHFRVTAQLIQVSDGYHLWAESFEWESQDELALEKQAADTIARAIESKLLGTSPWRAAGRGSLDPELFQRYIEAHDLVASKPARTEWTGRVPEHLERAARILEEVTAKDPQFAAAWAYLGHVYKQSLRHDPPRDAEFVEKTQAACRKAIELDETRADAHYELGSLLFYRLWDFQGATAELKRSVEINPRDPAAQSELADLLRITGFGEEALVEVTRALTFDPSSPQLEFQIGLHLLDRKDYNEAMRHASRALALQADYTPAIWLEGLVFEQQQRWAEAESRYRRALEIRPDDSRALPALGHLLAKTGRRGEAEKILADLEQQLAEGRAIEYWLALIQVGLGNTEKALSLLEQGYEQRDASTPYIGVDPRFSVLRDEPRFLALKQRLKLG